MSKPESVKIDPWTEFPRQSFSLLTDDFVHDKLFTLKVNSKGEKSTVNFKANVKGEKGAFKLSDEIKFWFNLPGGRSFYSKVKSGDSMKLHFDNGIIEKHSKKLNLYATLNLSKTLTNASLRLGAAHKGENCNSDNRLKIDFTSDNQSNLTWYNRTVVTKDKFTFGSMLVYGISSKVLSKSNFLLGYKVNDKVDAALRVENNTFKTSQFKLNEIISHLDSYKVDIVAKHDKNIKYGLEVPLTLFRPFLSRTTERTPSMKPCLLSSMRTRRPTRPARSESAPSLTFQWPTSIPAPSSRTSPPSPLEPTDLTSKTTREPSRPEPRSNSMYDSQAISYTYQTLASIIFHPPYIKT